MVTYFDLETIGEDCHTNQPSSSGVQGEAVSLDANEHPTLKNKTNNQNKNHKM